MKHSEIDCSALGILIDEKIHDERNRKILKRKLIDNAAYCQLAAEFHLSDRQIKNIVKKSKMKMGIE